MPKLIDLSGTVLDRLTIISYQGNGKYLCHCSCGNKTHITKAKYIQQKRVRSCGCIKKEQAVQIGAKYGMLTVVHKLGNSLFIFSCDCGNQNFIRNGRDIKGGKIKSCGCVFHNMTNSIEYQSWKSMKERCYGEYNKDYHNYGERGIRVCDEWLTSFKNFYHDMGPRPSKNYSIDRINNDGNYCPENCRWATAKEQANNQKTNRIIEYDNKKYSVKQFTEKIKISTNTFYTRLKSGWTISQMAMYYKDKNNVI